MGGYNNKSITLFLFYNIENATFIHYTNTNIKTDNDVMTYNSVTNPV